MVDLKVTSHAACKCLVLLQNAQEPMTAATLAAALSLAGNRESQRRRVRKIVDYLRNDQGVKIVANLQVGYWLTNDEATWLQWNEHRQIDAKKIIGESQKRKRESGECHQGFLFTPKQGFPD